MEKKQKYAVIIIATIFSSILIGFTSLASKDAIVQAIQLVAPVKFFGEVQLSALRAATSPQKKPLLVITGGSSMREAILSEAALDGYLEGKLRALNLSSTSQPLWYGLENAYRAVCQTGGVVSIAVNLNRFRHDPYNHRREDMESFWSDSNALQLKDRSRFILRAMQEASYKVLRWTWYSVTKGSANESRLGLYSYYGGLHHYGRIPLDNLGTEKPMQARFLKSLLSVKIWKTNEVLMYIDTFRKKLETCKDTKIIFIVPAINPLYRRDAYEVLERKHFSMLEQWGKSRDISIIDLNKPIAIEAKHFADMQHLRSEWAMMESTKRLATGVIMVYEKK